MVEDWRLLATCFSSCLLYVVFAQMVKWVGCCKFERERSLLSSRGLLGRKMEECTLDVRAGKELMELVGYKFSLGCVSWRELLNDIVEFGLERPPSMRARIPMMVRA